MQLTPKKWGGGIYSISRRSRQLQSDESVDGRDEEEMSVFFFFLVAQKGGLVGPDDDNEVEGGGL